MKTNSILITNAFLLFSYSYERHLYGINMQNTQFTMARTRWRWCLRCVTQDDMVQLEHIFKINIQRYELMEDNSTRSMYNSCCRHSDDNNSKTSYLNMYRNHLSYIQNIGAHVNKFQCRIWQKSFSRVDACKRHMQTCKGATNLIHPRGYFNSNKNIFEDLESVGVVVPQNKRFFPWFAVFDFEAIQNKPINGNTTIKLQWTTEQSN